MYNHGPIIKEAPTTVPSSHVSKGGLHVVFGTAPVNRAINPYNITNKPTIVNSYADAVKLFGYSTDFKSYTIPEAVYAYFKMQSIAPLCIINVLDPTKHIKDYSKTIQVVNGECTIDDAEILADTITVKSGENTLTAETDYIVEFSDNAAVITFISETSGEVTVTGSCIDVTKVTDEDIVGGLNEATGERTGLELIRNIYPTFGRYVSIFTVPKYSSSPTVAAAMQVKTSEINGMFKCENIIDIDTTKAPTYDKVEATKEEMALISEHTIAVWPKVKSNDLIMDYSVVLAAKIAAEDNENNDIPYLSPSNKTIHITALCDAEGKEIMVDKLIGDELNGIGVVTAINMNGFRTWGNNTAAYPNVTDPKDRWISCRRFFTWNENRFAATYFHKIDMPISHRLIENILNEENQYCSSLVSNGYCAAAKIELGDDNDILNGKISFVQKLSPYTPAESIVNTFMFDIDALMSSLKGEV